MARPQQHQRIAGLQSVPTVLFGTLRALVIASFLAIAVRHIDVAGLQYDEVLFVNAALGGIGDAFVHRRLFGVPVMVMPYIGALKSWLHAPIFALFGVSTATMRVPSLLICGASLYLYSRLAETLFGRRLALLLLGVLATDPAFFFSSRFDFGPVDLMIFFKAAAMVAFFAWLQRPSGWRLWGLMLALALGTFDKLNFVWFSLALIVSAIVVFPRAVQMALLRSGLIGWLAVTFAAVFSTVVSVSVIIPLLRGATPQRHDGGLSFGRVLTVWHLAISSLDGTGLWAVLLAVPPPNRVFTSLFLAVGLLALLPGFAIGAVPERDPVLGSYAQMAGFFAALFLAVLVLMVATPQATGPHHAMMLFPLHVFALFAVVAFGLDRAGAYRRLCMTITLVLMAGLIASQTGSIAAYLRRVQEPTSFGAWTDPAIFKLSAIVHSKENDVIVSADWGLHTQLFSLAPAEDRLRYIDLWAPLNKEEGLTVAEKTDLFNRVFARRTAFVVLHSPTRTFMHNARSAYLTLEREFLVQTSPGQTIRNASGEALYELRFVTAR